MQLYLFIFSQFTFHKKRSVLPSATRVPKALQEEKVDKEEKKNLLMQGHRSAWVCEHRDYMPRHRKGGSVSLLQTSRWSWSAYVQNLHPTPSSSRSCLHLLHDVGVSEEVSSLLSTRGDGFKEDVDPKVDRESQERVRRDMSVT
jgi:hypothetical protein